MVVAEPVKLLFIEDNPNDVALLMAFLERPELGSFQITHVDRLRTALSLLDEAPFDVVLTDLNLPDSDGLRTIKCIQSVRKDVPVVVLSGVNDEETALEIVQAGAQDYLIKGQGDGHLIARAMRHAIERKRAELRLLHLAHYDSLTGLANRALFHNRLEHARARAARRQSTVALMIMDLDRFKAINDTLGHQAGDRLLVLVAERLKGCIREADTVARLGGDEFTVIIENVGSVNEIGVVAHKVLNVMSAPFTLEGHEIYVTPSIGITLYPDDDDNADGLLKNADTAMYKAKALGRNNFQFYTSDMNTRSVERLKLESGLRQALDRGEFVLHYQPKMDLKTGRITGVEAMVRWHKRDGGLIAPGDFIPIAEETGLIVPIGEWVLREALRQNRAWQAAALPPLRVAVNLSARQFRQNDLAEVIRGALEGAGLSGENLEVEITESLLMEDTAVSTATLRMLKDRGVRVSVDDFGTGYSSLSYLKRFPIDALKIDRSFVRDITTDPDDATIATAIIGLAHNLRRGVIAEGVETGEQLQFLRDNDCDEAQGFLFSRPVTAVEMTMLLQREQTHPAAVNFRQSGPAPRIAV